MDGSGVQRSVLSDDELRNLTIRRGNLLPEEREMINNHIAVTIDMLDNLPFPAELARVPEYAGGHHEKMDGSGYPQRSEAGGHVDTGAHDGDRRYFRSAHLS